MQTTLSWIWTQVSDSISLNNNCYAKCASKMAVITAENKTVFNTKHIVEKLQY